jgi:hypothetical protein
LGIKPETISNPLHRLKRQVALPSFEATYVRPVPTQHLGEGLLGETPFLPITLEVSPYGLLEVAHGHAGNRVRPLLDGLHTYK